MRETHEASLHRVDGQARPADTVNAVFDAAAELVEAAAALRHAAEQPGAAGAAPAVLGCVEVVERQLAAVSRTLRDDADALLVAGRGCATTPSSDRSARMRSGFDNLEVALGDAAAAAAAARSLTARALHGSRSHGA